MDRFIKQLEELMDIIQEYSDSIKRVPHDYGCGVNLYMGEIHLLEAIANHPDKNMTELAELRGLTKSTISKTVRKLEKHGMIRRYRYVDNNKEFYFKLTPLGRAAFDGHYAYHEKRSQHTYNCYNTYSTEQKKLILAFLRTYVEYLHDYI